MPDANEHRARRRRGCLVATGGPRLALCASVIEVDLTRPEHGDRGVSRNRIAILAMQRPRAVVLRGLRRLFAGPLDRV
jgi:hypothetical protein